MARLSRLCIPGLPHVVLQRGHSRSAIFEDDTDRQLFRDLLREACQRHNVQIHGYSLQSGQILLLATPSSADGLSKVMQDIGRRYVARFNRRHGRSGALWEGRFRATVVEPRRHLLASMRFVEGLAGGLSALDQSVAPWSSASHHLGERVDPLITEALQFWALGNTPFEREAAYRHLSEQALTQQELSGIQSAVLSGWPLGDGAFVAALAPSTARRLAPGKRGRPRKVA